MQARILPVTEAETADCCDALLTRLIRDEGRYHGNLPAFAVKNWYCTTLADPARITLVAWQEGAVVGFLHGFLKEDPCILPEAQLDALFVEETVRGQGVGSALIAAFLNWCRSKGAGWAEVSVWEENPAAALYRAAGFSFGRSILRKKL